MIRNWVYSEGISITDFSLHVIVQGKVEFYPPTYLLYMKMILVCLSMLVKLNIL
jgi:hypothetical protein